MEVEFKEKSLCERIDLVYEKLTEAQKQIAIYLKKKDVYKRQEFPLYKTEGFKKYYTDKVMADSFGYAGTEIIRRVVGDSKAVSYTHLPSIASSIFKKYSNIWYNICNYLRE